MDRKAIARETLEIMKRGTYEAHGTTIDIIKQHRASVDNSLLFTPEQAETLAATYVKREPPGRLPVMRTMNCSTVDAVLRLSREGAVNPGGTELCQCQESRRRVPKRGNGTGRKHRCFQRTLPDPDQAPGILSEQPELPIHDIHQSRHLFT